MALLTVRLLSGLKEWVIVLTIAQQTGAGTLVQTDQTEVLHDPEGGAARSALDILGNLTLHLQTDLDNLKWIGEDLETKRLVTARHMSIDRLLRHLPLDRHRQYHQPGPHGDTRSCWYPYQ